MSVSRLGGGQIVIQQPGEGLVTMAPQQRRGRCGEWSAGAAGRASATARTRCRARSSGLERVPPGHASASDQPTTAAVAAEKSGPGLRTSSPECRGAARRRRRAPHGRPGRRRSSPPARPASFCRSMVIASTGLLGEAANSAARICNVSGRPAHNSARRRASSGWSRRRGDQFPADATLSSTSATARPPITDKRDTDTRIGLTTGHATGLPEPAHPTVASRRTIRPVITETPGLLARTM